MANSNPKRTTAQQTAAEQIRKSGGFAHDDDADDEEEDEDAGEGLGTRVTAGIRGILGKMKQPAAGGTRK